MQVLLGMMKRLPHTITNEPYVACWPTLKCNLLTAVTSLLLYNGDGILLETVTRLASLVSFYLPQHICLFLGRAAKSGFQDVAFLSSKASFPPHFIKLW